MQEKLRRSNPQRTQATRHALLAASRELFISKGYAVTSTPEIALAVGMTRGALYHHFRDKSDLFRAVLELESRTVAEEIEAAAGAGLAPRRALIAGAEAYLQAMTVPGRTRLLLIEGPAVLGSAAMRALDEAHAERTLGQGLKAAMAAGRRKQSEAMPAVPLAILLSAAFDRAALAIDSGADGNQFRAVLIALIERVLGDEPAQRGRRKKSTVRDQPSQRAGRQPAKR